MAPQIDDQRQHFHERYEHSGAGAVVDAELEVLGSDFQANGYTTRDQADELGRRLELRAGDRLLDLGSGCGWPGIYLSERHGCWLVALDPVAEGMRTASARAECDGLGADSGFVVGHGAAMPFRRRAFDAIVHTDVTC